MLSVLAGTEEGSPCVVQIAAPSVSVSAAAMVAVRTRSFFVVRFIGITCFRAILYTVCARIALRLGRCPLLYDMRRKWKICLLCDFHIYC